MEKEILEQERRALYWLCEASFLGAASIQKLGIYFERFGNLINIEEIPLLKSGILKKNQAEALLEWKQVYEESQSRYDHLEERGIQFITPLEEAYPGRLREIHSYPMGLFVRGTLPAEDKPVLAIGGARGCSA